LVGLRLGTTMVLRPEPFPFRAMNTDDIKRALMSKVKKKPQKAEYLSTGCKVLDLAVSDKTNGGFPLGSYVYLVGDSMSGKTWLSLSCMAEASIDPRFDQHRFIYDNVERGVRMNLERYFGSRMAERIEPPAWDGDEPIYSQFVEEFYFNIDDALDDGRPFIYVLDSMDGLDTFDDEDKFDEWKKAHREGKDATGSYGMSKAKANSMGIRRLMGKLEKSNSLLIIISQTRDNVKPGSFQPKTRAGGRSLRFYATLEMWSAVKGKIKRTVKGKDRQLGNVVKIDVKKNRNTGREHTVEIPIYHSFGIDDVGACTEYLLAEGVWKKKSSKIEATGIGPTLEMPVERLIRTIEENDLVEDLHDLVGQTWLEIEEATRIKRKSRYE